MRKVLFFILVALLFSSCSKELLPEFSSFTDERDGNTYDVVTLGTQTWMAENLKYLPQVNNWNEFWEDHSTVIPMYYIDGYNGSDVEEAMDHPNYDIYGVLYNFPAAEISCPTGWRLPGEEDWKELKDHVGRSNSEAIRSEDLWISTLKGTNESGFNLRPSTNGDDVAVWSTGQPTDVPGRRYSWGFFSFSGKRFTHDDKDDYELAFVRCIREE